MKVGSARVSGETQNTEPQIDALKQAGCERIFEETTSGAQRDRPQLQTALDYLRAGDEIVVWRLDRLARSLKQLLETIALDRPTDHAGADRQSQNGPGGCQAAVLDRDVAARCLSDAGR